MAMGASVLEREVIHAGKVFIKAGQENMRAYVVQKGAIRSFVMDGEQKVEVGTHGPGTIIGEICLLLDDPIVMNYEVVSDATVVTITRQEFQKKLSRVDSSIKTILNHVMKKLSGEANRDIEKAKERAKIDETAFQLVKGLIAGLPPDKQFEYENAILPHVNSLIKAIKELKAKDKNAGAAVESSFAAAMDAAQGE